MYMLAHTLAFAIEHYACVQTLLTTTLTPLCSQLTHITRQDLLAELARSQLEVKRMLGMQSAQAAELGGLKDKLASEVRRRGSEEQVRGLQG